MVARIGWVHPSCQNGPHREHQVGHHNPQDEEDTLVHHDLQRSGQLEGTPEDDGAELPDRPTGFLRDPQHMKRHFIAWVELLLKQT